MRNIVGQDGCVSCKHSQQRELPNKMAVLVCRFNPPTPIVFTNAAGEVTGSCAVYPQVGDTDVCSHHTVRLS